MRKTGELIAARWLKGEQFGFCALHRYSGSISALCFVSGGSSRRQVVKTKCKHRVFYSLHGRSWSVRRWNVVRQREIPHTCGQAENRRAAAITDRRFIQLRSSPWWVSWETSASVSLLQVWTHLAPPREMLPSAETPLLRSAATAFSRLSRWLHPPVCCGTKWRKPTVWVQ